MATTASRLMSYSLRVCMLSRFSHVCLFAMEIRFAALLTVAVNFPLQTLT